MKYLSFILSALCFIVSFLFIFCLIGYKFTGMLIFALGIFFLYLALSSGTKKKALVFARRIIILCVSLCVLFTVCMSSIVISDMDGDIDTACDCVIVLGAGLDGEVPSLTLADRLNRTLDYMNNFPEATAIVSGGQGSGETITEALAMERYLVARGIDESRIIKEESATSTNENLIFSKKIAFENGFDTIAIVSSDYHIFRARLLAKKQDIDAVMLSAKSSLPILRINYAIREGFALVKAKMLGHI